MIVILEDNILHNIGETKVNRTINVFIELAQT